jgi:hypothetical protein
LEFLWIHLEYRIIFVMSMYSEVIWFNCVVVSMYPENENYGAVRVWMDDVGSYSLVCADGFTDTEAKTACMDMGFVYGKSLCCSAFGDIDGQVSTTNVSVALLLVIYSAVDAQNRETGHLLIDCEVVALTK